MYTEQLWKSYLGDISNAIVHLKKCIKIEYIVKVTVYHSISVIDVGGVQVEVYCDDQVTVCIDGIDIKLVHFLSKCITSVYRNDSRQSQMRR